MKSVFSEIKTLVCDCLMPQTMVITPTITRTFSSISSSRIDKCP